MINNWKKALIVIVQAIVFYLFPLLMKQIGPMGMIFSIIVTTFILSILIGLITKGKIKYLYPIIVAIMFIPSVYIYYNDSAFIHTLWYLLVSFIGILIGTIIEHTNKR